MTLEQKRLRFGAVVIIGFGVLSWAALVIGYASPLVLLTNLVTLSEEGAQVFALTTGRVLGVIMGGLCVGLGVAVWMLSGRLLGAMPQETRAVMLATIWGWYLIDSSGSILVGAPVNALANLSFLILVIWPIWAAKRDERAAATA